MITELFTNLNHAIEELGGIRISAAFAWGLLSILLSPCHLASIPLVVGFISQQKEKSLKKASAISLVFFYGDINYYRRSWSNYRYGWQNAQGCGQLE